MLPSHPHRHSGNISHRIRKRQKPSDLSVLALPNRVPFGGPYPEQRKFPQPSTKPVIPAPVVVQQSYGKRIDPKPKPDPCWLKYQHQ